MKPTTAAPVVATALAALLAACGAPQCQTASPTAPECPMSDETRLDDPFGSPTSQPGALGMPLGAVVPIEGVIFDGTATRTKELDGVLLVDVDRVGGAALASPVRLRFEAFVGTVLAPKAAGERVTWVVYETGAYTGVPSEAFKYAPAVSTWSFRFDTWLVVLQEQGANAGPRP